MRVHHQGKLYRVDDSHPHAAAIVALALGSKNGPASRIAAPQRNDVKQLWRHLRPPHRRFLRAVAKDAPIPQEDLQKRLGLDWKELRGVHNGLARICERLGIEKPLRTSGYKTENRIYEMSADAAATIQKIPRKRK